MDRSRPKAAQRVAFGPSDDRFELKSQLDKGSQGTVFICTRRKTGMKNAVKRIDVGSLELRRNAGKVRVNLEREIYIMRELHHPKIINLIEAFWEGDVCFIVMDLALGGTLHDKLVPGTGLGDEEGSKYVAFQLLEGLGYMHSHEVIHRDMKPANVLITNEIKKGMYEVKIADFGLSRALNEPGGEDAGMTKVGTPAFAAPEIFGAAYNEKVDFWSLGCILFTMVCGEYPFSEMPEHVKHPKNGSCSIISCAAWSSVSQDGQEVCRGLLNPDPEERFDLHACLSHHYFADLHDQQLLISRHPSRQSTLSRSTQRVAVKRSGTTAGYEQEVAAAVGVVSSIRGWNGSAVDSVEINFRNGDQQIHGGGGGNEYSEWALEPDELIIAVTQERQGDGYLGNAFVFFTTHGRSIAILGGDAAEKERFAAAAGTQIVGLMFQDSRLEGIIVQKTEKKGVTTHQMEGLVQNIWGSVGHAVDGVIFTLRDGEQRTYGTAGGDVQQSWDLGRQEAIIIAEQGWRDAFLGYSLSFYTSAGNVYSLRGVSAAQSLRFMTSNGDQICGLEFQDGWLSEVHTCKRDGDMFSITRHTVENKFLENSQPLSPLSPK